MNIQPLGLDYSTGELLFEPIDSQEFSKKILDVGKTEQKNFSAITTANLTLRTFRYEAEAPIVDIANPREAGWTFLIGDNCPNPDEIINTIKPLAKYRGMKNPDKPLILNNSNDSERWFDWIIDEYHSLDLTPERQTPQYVMIVGGPDQIPFNFQAILDSMAFVGRIDFDSIDEIKTYVEKIIKLEKSQKSVVEQEALIFATNHGDRDPTYLSHHFMAEPLSQHIRNHTKYSVTTKTIFAEEATKQNLLQSFKATRPAIVYTASHGMGAPRSSLEIQKRITGAICCEKNNATHTEDYLVSGDDITHDVSILEGSIFFQFACLGYGSPKYSDLEHWMSGVGGQVKIAETDFISALPKKMLSHPKGPIGFIGHWDNAVVHGFDNPKDPIPEDKWNPRIQPYVTAVDDILLSKPIGLAMSKMSKRYDLANAKITRLIDRHQRQLIDDPQKFYQDLSDTFIMRIDAQNFKIFGDPAARVNLQ